MGATAFGVTKPIFVTGGGTKASAYTNPKTGTHHTGVCAKEYQNDVLPRLLSEGKRLLREPDGLIHGCYSRTMHVLM